MSYDVYLEIDTGGEESALLTEWNYTSNCAAMWTAAGAPIRDFHGKPASECAVILRAAIDTMRADPARFRAMDPPNGWGSYETLLPALEGLLSQMVNHPKATVSVSR